MTAELPSIYQQFIAISRYSRYRDDLGRRETWEEVIDRYITFFKARAGKAKNKLPWVELKEAILNLEVMPSMRALMSAGEALDKDNVAGYNCSYLPIDNAKAFDELMYILMCFHPDTKVKTKSGGVAISELQVGDEVMSYDESTKQFTWKPVTQVIQTPSAQLSKVELVLENGQVIRCTTNHKWLTENRGWVDAGELTVDDELVAPKYTIYKVTNKINGKIYIGYTSKTPEQRLLEHIHEAGDVVRYKSHFKKAIRKHGSNVWVIEGIDWAHTRQDAKIREKNWIKQFDSKVNGYNSTIGGDGASGHKWTDEQRSRASQNAYVRTPEQIERQRKVLIASQEKINKTRRTPEYREHQRKVNTGPGNPMYGHQYTDAERKVKVQQAKTMVRDASGRFK